MREPLLRNWRVLQGISTKDTSDSKVPRHMYNRHRSSHLVLVFLPQCTIIPPENRFKNAAGSCP